MASHTPSKIHPVYDRQNWSEEEIVDLSAVAGIDFVVIDGIMCLERKKSYTGDNQLRLNTIVADVDPVAVDHVCASLFGLNPDNIAHIFLAEKVGMGTNDPEYIEVAGASVESTMKRAVKTSRFVGSNRTWILSPPFEGTSIAEEYISNEKDYILQSLKDGLSETVFFFDDKTGNHLHLFKRSESLLGRKQ